MDNIAFLYSLLLFTESGIYAVFGAYVIINSSRSGFNRTFFALCMALFIWSFGSSIAISAPDLETCQFWRRISAIGWGVMYSILLHFFFILTGRTNILAKAWIYPLIYLPAAVSVYIFLASPDMVLASSNYVQTPLGWLIYSKAYYWDWFLNIYYAGSVMVSTLLVWQWGQKAKTAIVQRHARLILLSIFIVLFIGTLSDIVVNSYFSIDMLQIGPTILILPVTACFISVKKCGLMNLTSQNQERLVLNEETRAKMYLYITFALIIGGFLNFISQYFIYGISLRSVIGFSAFFILAGLFIQFVQRSSLAEDYKDYVILSILTLLVPLVTIHFIEFASITVWAFPFVFIITFIVYNQRRMIVYLAVSVLATQIFVWMLAPNVVVRVEASDHVIRIGLFALAIWAALYVNEVYLSRLKENANQIALQKLIVEITSDFVLVSYANLDEKINSSP